MKSIFKVAASHIISASSLTHTEETSKKRYASQFFFHTKLEPNPFVVLDLGEIIFADQLVIENRTTSISIAFRANSLRVFRSTNLVDWTEIAFTPDECLSIFTGAIGANIRYIRLSLQGIEIFHLKSVQLNNVSVAQPTDTETTHGSHGFFNSRTYFPIHNAGFFSITSMTLLDLLRYPHEIVKINASFAFADFKDSVDQDPWLEFFEPPNPSVFFIGGNEIGFTQRLAHDRYASFDLSSASIAIRKYYTPSGKVRSRVDYLCKKYEIDVENTIAVYYRGTDKSTELLPTPVESYIQKTQEILKRQPELRIFVQTDQKQIRDILLSAFGSRAFYLDDLPVTESSTGVHKLITENKLNFAIDFLATTIIMSRCKYVVTGTGNVSCWTVLFRGSVEGVHQF